MANTAEVMQLVGRHVQGEPDFAPTSRGFSRQEFAVGVLGSGEGAKRPSLKTLRKATEPRPGKCQSKKSSINRRKKNNNPRNGHLKLHSKLLDTGTRTGGARGGFVRTGHCLVRRKEILDRSHVCGSKPMRRNGGKTLPKRKSEHQ